LSSLKNEVIPLLLECQHRQSVLKKEGIQALVDSNADLFSDAKEFSLSSSPTLKHDSPVVCRAIVYKSGFSARANTVWSYGEINRAMIKNAANIKPETTEVAPGSQVGNDSLLGESSSVAAKTSVKRSVIGNHVKIGKHCKSYYGLCNY
jgi:translation initiation factor eIF-2B subunit gamma